MWIESHVELGDHPKKDALAELLFNGSLQDDVADYATIGLLHRLWWWTLAYTEDGDLTPFSDRQIAKGCRWAGDPATLVASLKRAGWVDKAGRVNDWQEYAGKLLERRARNAQQMREARERACTTRVQHVSNTSKATDLPTLKKTLPSSATPDDVVTQSDKRGDPLFDSFWAAYPRRVGKTAAHKRWRQLGKTDRKNAVRAAENIAAQVKTTGRALQFVQHPATFIGPARPFEDWVGGTPAGYVTEAGGSSGRALCPVDEMDLTWDEQGQHCPICGWRPS